MTHFYNNKGGGYPSLDTMLKRIFNSPGDAHGQNLSSLVDRIRDAVDNDPKCWRNIFLKLVWKKTAFNLGLMLKHATNILGCIEKQRMLCVSPGNSLMCEKNNWLNGFPELDFPDPFDYC